MSLRLRVNLTVEFSLRRMDWNCPMLELCISRTEAFLQRICWPKGCTGETQKPPWRIEGYYNPPYHCKAAMSEVVLVPSDLIISWWHFFEHELVERGSAGLLVLGAIHAKTEREG